MLALNAFVINLFSFFTLKKQVKTLHTERRKKKQNIFLHNNMYEIYLKGVFTKSPADDGRHIFVMPVM